MLDEVREAAAWVAGRARSVHVVEARVGAYAAELAGSGALDGAGGAGSGEPADAVVGGDTASTADPWAVAGAGPGAGGADLEAVTGLVLALDAVNFGSGWHPVVRKRPGCSGAVTMATNLRAWVDAHGPLTAERLADFSPALAHDVFDQPLDDPEVEELLVLFAAALAQLGRLVADAHDGSFVALVGSAGGSAAAFVETLRHLPTFDDVAGYDGRPVPILKRA